jgi:DNA-binding transcriptional LysR family regulator
VSAVLAVEDISFGAAKYAPLGIGMEQELRYIYEIYRTGSFSKAADNLNMTQPALSTSVRKTEERIGMPLFDRKTRPLSLTEAGRVYIDSIDRILRIEKDLDNHIHDMNSLDTGHLRIGGSHYMNAYILPSILTAFNQKYPGIKIEIMEASAATLSRMLTVRNIDLTFSCNHLFMKDFERYKAFHDFILLAVHKDNPINKKLQDKQLTYQDIRERRQLLADCPSVSLHEFANLPFILLTPGNNLRDRALRMFKDQGITPNIKLELSQLVTAFHLAAADYGVTFVSDRMILSDEVPLVYYRIDSELAHRQFYALLSNQDYTPKAVRTFIHFFQEQIQK